MLDGTEEWIDIKPVYCTYCHDLRFIVSLAANPCPRCNREAYIEWEKERERERKRCKNGKNKATKTGGLRKSR